LGPVPPTKKERTWPGVATRKAKELGLNVTAEAIARLRPAAPRQAACRRRLTTDTADFDSDQRKYGACPKNAGTMGISAIDTARFVTNVRAVGFKTASIT